MVRLFVLTLTAALSAAITLSCQTKQDDALQVNSGSEGVTNRGAPPLEGTLWKFIEIEGKPVVQFELEETPQIRLISADHTITAWLSCNLFEGTYEIDGETLRLHPMPVTWRECLESHEQEEAIRRVVQAVTSYRIDGDRLVLSAEGRVAAVLIPMDMK
jgi:heat shock protein HslJ